MTKQIFRNQSNSQKNNIFLSFVTDDDVVVACCAAADSIDILLFQNEPSFQSKSIKNLQLILQTDSHNADVANAEVN